MTIIRSSDHRREGAGLDTKAIYAGYNSAHAEAAGVHPVADAEPARQRPTSRHLDADGIYANYNSEQQRLAAKQAAQLRNTKEDS